MDMLVLQCTVHGERERRTHTYVLVTMYTQHSTSYVRLVRETSHTHKMQSCRQRGKKLQRIHSLHFLHGHNLPQGAVFLALGLAQSLCSESLPASATSSLS